jgi:hypothetical protein
VEEAAVVLAVDLPVALEALVAVALVVAAPVVAGNWQLFFIIIK